MRKWIAEVYRPAGFILLGALVGSALTLAIQGKLSTPYVALGAFWAFALGVLVVNGRRSKALYYLAVSLLGIGNAVGFWMRGKLPGGIIFTFVALAFASSAWAEHDRRKKLRANEIAQSV